MSDCVRRLRFVGVIILIFNIEIRKHEGGWLIMCYLIFMLFTKEKEL